MPVHDVFGALANPVRRRILELLRDRPRAAGDIASEFDVNRPAISEHLQVLRNAGLVSEVARGRQRFYHLNATALSEVGDWLHPFERYWQERMQALNDTLKEKIMIEPAGKGLGGTDGSNADRQVVGRRRCAPSGWASLYAGYGAMGPATL